MAFDFNDLQRRMLRSADFTLDIREALLVGAHGLTGEGGEISDLVKKIFYHNKWPFDAERRALLLEEMGDLLWYYMLISYYLKFSLAGYEDTLLYKEERRDCLADYGSFDFKNKMSHLTIHLAVVSTGAAEELEISARSIRYVDLMGINSALVRGLATMAIILETVESSIEEIGELNVQKLLTRYPDGFPYQEGFHYYEAVKSSKAKIEKYQG